MNAENQAIFEVLSTEDAQLVDQWHKALPAALQTASTSSRNEAGELLQGLRQGLHAGGSPEALEGPAWSALRQTLESLSRSRAAKGERAGDTSVFVLALKKPLFAALQRRFSSDPAALASALWAVTNLVDSVAQHTVTTFQLSREEIIRRQQEELLELSTPVVKLWEGVLAVPMIGVLDSSRTQLVMETLLQHIVSSGSALAIIDITGVPTVDTLVAQHLLKTVTAIRLMGADCIISGIRPQIAQTIVHLGIDLQGITTKASLADALALALARNGWRISRES